MKFLIDSMFPPATAEALRSAGHDVTTPALLGAANLPDEVLIEVATQQGRVLVTENAKDFAAVRSCVVVIVLKQWWPSAAMGTRLAAALDRWSAANPEPAPWPHWLPAELR